MSATAGQTIGPFFGFALPYAGDRELVPPTHPRAIRLHGIVTDGHDQPVPDALLELWQLDEDGAVVAQSGSLRRDGWTFTGFGRCATDPRGHYDFSTLRPGASPDRAAFFLLTLFSRGLTNRLFTRAYLPEDESARAADPFLASLSDDERARTTATSEATGYRFDVSLQGDREAVFLRYPQHG